MNNLKVQKKKILKNIPIYILNILNLLGEDISESKAKDSCDPIVYNKDLWDGIESVEIDGVRKELGKKYKI